VNITFYSFAKKANSTKQPPANSGTVLSCQLKADTDMLNPTLVINNTPIGWNPIWNYCQISNFKRYYFINSWSWRNGVWECSCAVDALASWKTDIGNNIEYILRTDSTVVYNDAITDTMYPATTDIDLNQYFLTSAFVSDISDGIYVVGIISGNDVQAVGAISYYAMSATEFGALKEALLSDDNLITMGMAALDPGTQQLVPLITDMSMEMLKAMYNPFQYIVSCMWFPFPKSVITSTPVSSIQIGWWNYSLSGNRITAQTLTLFEGPTSILPHPQASTRGKYLNHATYTRCTAYGVFGSVPMDLSYFDENDDRLIIRYMIDLITGNCRTRFESYVSSEQTPIHHTITERDFQIGVPIQLAQIATDYLGTAVAGIDAIGKTVSSAMRLDVGGAISNAAHGIYNTIEAAMPQLSTSGTNGSFLITNSHMQTSFCYQFYRIVDEDLTHKGRPVCANMLISSLSGYVLCAEGDLDLDCFAPERQMIAAFLTGGFFWE